MKNAIKNFFIIKIICKTIFYTRMRQKIQDFFKTKKLFVDDSEIMSEATVITLSDISIDKDNFLVGLIQDHSDCPYWTKFKRFLVNNNIKYEIYDLKASHWQEDASRFSCIIGYISSMFCDLDEQRRKFYFIEHYLKISCYPSYAEIVLYEDKFLEFYISKFYDSPFIKTYVSNSLEEVSRSYDEFKYPLVSKIIPSSGSYGVSYIKNKNYCKKSVKKIFSSIGKKTSCLYFNQKNYVYFQDYIKNSGYDLRIIVIDNMNFGYYRYVIDGDFRASGMGCVVKKDIPFEAIDIARKLYKKLNFIMLVVDLLQDVSGKFQIIEFTPLCRVDTPEQLHVNGVSGAYVFDGLKYEFIEGHFWIQELALKYYFEKKFKESVL